MIVYWHRNERESISPVLARIHGRSLYKILSHFILSLFLYMRKITRLAVNAFMNNDSIQLGNTRVDASGMLTELYLHENKIAEKVKFTEVIRITTA